MTLVDLVPPAIRDDRTSHLPIAIIGGGPVGLAAAAHLVERGIDFRVYEAGPSVGASIEAWGHTRLFSPWSHLVDAASRRLLQSIGWEHPAPGTAPTGSELVERYLRPLAAAPDLAGRIRTGVEVLAVSREGMDRTRSNGRSEAPFLLRLAAADRVDDVSARAVIDASGTYRTPNSLGSSGLTPLGLDDVADRISHALPDVLGRDRHRFADKHTTVVGAGHSAASTLLALARLAEQEAGTRVSWLIRRSHAARVSSSPDDELTERAALGRHVHQLVASGAVGLVEGFEIERLAKRADAVEITGRRGGEPASHVTDFVVNATGFRPDLGMLREIRLDLDDVVEAPRRLAPLIDPNIHTCGTVEPHGHRQLRHPEEGFFIAGMKSYGRAPTFLLATGYEQVRSITAFLAGDLAAASRVQLTLPAIGACSAPEPRISRPGR